MSETGHVTAAICFLLYFWSSYLGGTAGWLEVMLFVTGVIWKHLYVTLVEAMLAFAIGTRARNPRLLEGRRVP